MNSLIQKAFTLIELLVVIAVIGILSGLIVVSMSGVTDKATIAKAQVFSNSLRNSLMLNLVSEWKFDELSTAVDGTIIKDSWSGGNNGTLDINNVAVDSAEKLRSGSSCVSGKCVYFDGIDDSVGISSNVNMNVNKLTIEAWVKPLAVSAEAATIFYRTGSFILRYKSDTLYNFSFFVYDGSSYEIRAATALPVSDLDKWHHVVATYDKSLSVDNLKVYINGSLKGKSNKTLAIPVSSSVLYLSLPSTPICGILDDVRFYSDAAPYSLILENYYLGLNNLLANGGITGSEYLSRVRDNSFAYNIDVEK